jgi:hypothetical protein
MCVCWGGGGVSHVGVLLTAVLLRSIFMSVHRHTAVTLLHLLLLLLLQCTARCLCHPAALLVLTLVQQQGKHCRQHLTHRWGMKGPFGGGAEGRGRGEGHITVHLLGGGEGHMCAFSGASAGQAAGRFCRWERKTQSGRWWRRDVDIFILLVLIG